MRTTLGPTIMSLAISSVAVAQQSTVNQSIDPAWLFVPEQIAGSEFVVTESVMGSDIPVQYRFVELLDGVYAPIGVRTPEGDGPFPTVVFAHMNGGFGLRWVREWTNYGSGTLEQFLDAGYAVVWMRYRAEVDTLYGDELTVREFQGRQRYSRGPLEYEDAIAIVEYVKGLPAVDSDRVGWLGVSHGGEMLMKVASEYGGLRAGVAAEPASMDYLALLPPDPNAQPTEPLPETMEINTIEMQAETLSALRKRLDPPVITRRIDAVTMPILTVSRVRDHNQAVFRLSYELLQEAGKEAEWKSYDHDHHGFIFIQRNAAGEYVPDSIQSEAVRDVISFFDRHMN
ncbi:MAG: prolyl oligopeptidase family serine peptidase [Gammaproteobacteria bacterium]